MMKKATSLLAVIAAFAACTDSTKEYPNVPGGNPLVPDVAAYPFPSDFYLEADPSTATGKRVVIPAEALPSSLPPSLVGDADGFSRMPMIVTYLPGGVDPGSLPALDDHAATVADDSPAFLIEEGTFDRIPILIETDLGAPDPAGAALLIRPLRLLAPGTGYVVVLRDMLQDLEGNAHEAGEAFRALRDGIKTKDPAIESQREDFVLVNQAIAHHALDPEEVVLAWSFHTRSASQVQDTLLALHDLVELADIEVWSIDEDGDWIDAEAGNRQIRATFEAPNFIDAETGLIARDAAGQPIQQGTRTVPFSITIPESVEGPRPVVVYGHGFFGSYVQGTRGTINALSHTYGFTTVATYIGFSEDIMPMVIGSLTGDLSGLEAVVAEVQQNIANQTALARLVRERLSVDLEIEGPDGPTLAVDGNEVHYMGISNGGTFGTLTAATSTQFERAALLVGGGGLIHFLERAVQWNEYGALLGLLYRDPLPRQLLLSVLQMVLDPVDPISYSEHLVHDRFPNRRELKALVLMAVNDSQVRNLVSEWVVRTADIPLVTPSPKDVYGLRTITAEPPLGTDELGAFFVYDEQVEPTPLGNTPPADENGTHGTVHRIPEAREQIGTFLMEGILAQYCGGPCLFVQPPQAD